MLSLFLTLQQIINHLVINILVMVKTKQSIKKDRKNVGNKIKQIIKQIKIK